MWCDDFCKGLPNLRFCIVSLGINWTSLMSAYPPEVLFAMKACLGILERGNRSASFSSGLLSLGKPPGSMIPQLHLVSSMSCLPSPHSHPAVWGSAMVPTAQNLCGKLSTFRPRILPWQPPHSKPGHHGPGEGVETWVELDLPWRLRVLPDLV